MATISQLVVELRLQANNFNNALRAQQKELKEFEKTIAPTTKALTAIGDAATSAGKALTVGLTVPLAGFAAVAVKQFSESAEAAALVENAIKSTGGAAGKTATELQKMASALEKNSLFEDDEILRKVTTNLLTFTNVAGPSFERAQQAALNLSTVLKQDLQSSTIQIGKALNDPIAGITALKRVGVSFTETQRDMIKNFVQQGDIVSAQNVILKELEKEFGGAAAAAAAAGSGPFVQLAIQLGNLTEKFGEVILKGLQPIIPILQAAVAWFQGLGTTSTTIIVVLGLLAAVIGPLLVVFGTLVTGIVAAIPVFAAAAGAIAAIGPEVLAVVAAVVVVTGAIASFVAGLFILITSNEQLMASLTAAWLQIQEAAAEIWPQIVELFQVISESLQAIWMAWGPSITKAFETLITVASAMIANLGGAISIGLKAVSGVIQAFTGLITGDWNKMCTGVNKIWSALWDAVKAIVTNAINALKASILGWTAAVSNAFKAMYDAVVGNSYVPDMIDGIRDAFGRLGDVMVDPTRRATQGVMSSFRNMFDTVKGFATDWKGSLKNLGMGVLESVVNQSGGPINLLKGIFTGNAGGLPKTILGSLKGVLGIGGGTSGGGGGAAGAAGGIGGMLGGIFGGAGGGVGSAAMMSNPVSAGISGGIQLAQFAIEQIGKIGQGRKSANEIVKSQDAFVNSTLAGILGDSSLSPSNQLKMVNNAWDAYQANLSNFAAGGGPNSKTANQSFATVSPLVSKIQQDLMKAGATEGGAGGGGNTYNFTVNAPFGTADAIAQAVFDIFHRNVGGVTEEAAKQIQIKAPAVVAV